MVSVIIPTLNAENEINNLIEKLNNQTVKPDEIIIIDSESEDNTVEKCMGVKNVHCKTIERSQFDHGRTRDMALKDCIGDYVVFMTQDAIPYNEFLIENLIDSFNINDQIAIVTARQIPKDDACLYEKRIREYNYPNRSFIRTQNDIEKLGIKAFFSSDVCCAYKKDIYLKCGGFDYPIKTNEDMFMAAKILNNGYSIMYCANAMVHHSHNFTLIQQYKRNYIQGYEIAKHGYLLGKSSLTGEGLNLVRFVGKSLLREGHIMCLIRFAFDCMARFIGNRSGRKAYEKSDSV